MATPSAQAPPPLCHEDLAHLHCRSGCNADHAGGHVSIHARCHPHRPLDVSYNREDRVLSFNCSKCNTLVSFVAVATQEDRDYFLGQVSTGVVRRVSPPVDQMANPSGLWVPS